MKFGSEHDEIRKVVLDYLEGAAYWSRLASLPPGAPVTAATFQSMGSGWNLIAVGESPSASAFNKALSPTAPAADQIPINLTTLWAWDATLANWYFYAPSLEQERRPRGLYRVQELSRLRHQNAGPDDRVLGEQTLAGIGVPRLSMPINQPARAPHDFHRTDRQFSLFQP